MDPVDRQQALVERLLMYVAAADPDVFYGIAERYQYNGKPIHRAAGVKTHMVIHRIIQDLWTEPEIEKSVES